MHVRFAVRANEYLKSVFAHVHSMLLVILKIEKNRLKQKLLIYALRFMTNVSEKVKI